jgi:hypothetical protein
MAHIIDRHDISRLIAFPLVVVCALLADWPTHAQQNAANVAPSSCRPPLPLSGIIPVVVNVPATATPLEARPCFDDFSWRSFIALNWPAAPNERGVPKSPHDGSVFLNAGQSYLSVWGTYRTASALYRIDSKPPVPFSSSQGTNTICGETTLGSEILLMAAKSGTLLQDVDQAFSYPLVDQNNNYIYYEIRFNADQYEFVRQNQLYLAKKLMQAEMKAPIAMPISSPKPYRQGAIMLKAAWKQMTPADDSSRYYTVKGVILDESTGNPVCRDVTLGLVAFHIGHKVDGLPQWVWSSFEQVDNVPSDDGSKPAGRMTLNNGTNDPPTVGGWANRPASKHEVPAGKRVKAQVTRLSAIPTTPTGASTVDINNYYRKLLAKTVWANYQLVITQWPATPVAQNEFKPKEDQGIYPKDSGQPFPVNNAVNTAMETFFQSQTDAAGAGGKRCTQCHYGAGIADYSWSLVLRSK